MKKEIYVVLFCVLITACGGSSSSSDDGGGGGGGGGGGVSDISMTMPTDVVVASPTAAIGTSQASVSATVSAKADEADDYETQKEEVTTLVAGTGDCTFSVEPMQDLSNANCYGPSVNFTNHPTRVPADGNFGGGDLGIWNADNLNNSSEACAAAQMNNVVEFAGRRVNTFVKAFAAVVCAGKKAAVALPAVGSSTDLSSAISSFVSIPNLTFSSVIFERLADSGSNPVYKFNVAGTLSNAGADRSFTATLKHVPTATDNSTYKGKISFSLVTSTSGQPGNCGDAAQGFAAVTSPGSVDAGTILYEKTSATSLVQELNMGSFCGADTNPFDSDNNISVTDTLSVSNPDGYGNGYDYGLFSLNPANGTGSVASAWVAGLGAESSRTLNVTTAEASDDSASGNAYFGFGPAMASSTETDRGTITGMQCNWGSGVSVPNVQHQKLVRPANGTAFGSDSSDLHISFAPTNDCDSTGGGFTYDSIEGGMDNDNPSGAAVSNNLLDIDSMSFTKPTPPGDV